MAKTNCKFTCTELKLAGVTNDNTINALGVKLTPLYNANSKEDGEFSKYTPSGNFDFVVTNENVLPMFSLGKKYKVTIEEIEE